MNQIVDSSGSELGLSMPHPRIILASGSPRRRQLLEEAGFDIEVIVPDDSAECGVCSGQGPAETVAELALRKAQDVAPRAGAGILVSGDTLAECQGQILGKPRDRDHAEAMLRQMSGREHRVLTGVCVWNLSNGEPDVRVEVTSLRMDTLTDAMLETYLDSGGWEGKAGAFGYQDGLDWVHIIKGSPSNVVGLPVELLAKMLIDANVAG